METVTEKCKQNFNKPLAITMRRKGSPHVITITSDKDPHFSNVRIVKRVTGEVRGSHFILTSDVQQWVGMYRADGFAPVEGGDND
jgi:hypothetical protein